MPRTPKNGQVFLSFPEVVRGGGLAPPFIR